MTDAVEVLRIDSLEDERLDAYVRLTERELRCVLEPQKGIFIAESAKVIERAVRAGYEPVSFLLGERWLDQMMPLFERLVVREGAGPVPVFVASMELMEQLTGFNVTRGALAAFRRPRQIPVDEFLGGVVEAAEGAPGARVRARGYCRPHERGCDFPLGRRAQCRRYFGQSDVLRPAVPSLGPREHGHGVSDAVDAYWQ